MPTPREHILFRFRLVPGRSSRPLLRIARDALEKGFETLNQVPVFQETISELRAPHISVTLFTVCARAGIPAANGVIDFRS